VLPLSRQFEWTTTLSALSDSTVCACLRFQLASYRVGSDTSRRPSTRGMCAYPGMSAVQKSAMEFSVR
jgi:hypothetical protein